VSKVVLSVGSNEGNREEWIESVVTALGATVVARSSLYETAPWGPVPQPDYLNAVVIAEDATADSTQWWARARACEERAGRRREVRWGPRTLDVDLIQVTEGEDPVLLATPVLTLPHPHAHERAFVLVPWVEIEPDAVLAGQARVRDLLAALPDRERASVRLQAVGRQEGEPV
jgi:2-amino-4-hydroxy-6-hydroxymethyldihydropteridine diphosphokinase